MVEEKDICKKCTYRHCNDCLVVGDIAICIDPGSDINCLTKGKTYKIFGRETNLCPQEPDFYIVEDDFGKKCRRYMFRFKKYNNKEHL